ncbi:Hsp70 family protein [Fastidiosibacter lacustris]|uniref:Hsp70 family protein n=1 Tax=Fastidiosibacter lacustris TaxID=2056695 RepID=UPI000E3503C1|nr:Hsp70 family protein [Fastidiosibacter lacustris]
MSHHAKYLIGIDLGTTNSAITYKRLKSEDSICSLAIPQFFAKNQYESKILMPSFLYIPSELELTLSDINLPWQSETTVIVGEHAKLKAQTTPNRVISSVKSWLCQSSIDKRKALLPYQAAEGVERISPLEAYTYYFEHIKKTWNSAFPDAPLFQQKIIITIPASFEPAARDLTAEAARLCDFEDVILLEEPQASLYGWINNNENWRDKLSIDDTILVIDVGGGTTDFSLIKVEDDNGNLALRRIAVGDHILIGGDNIDLMLAHTLQQRLLDSGQRLEPWQMQALVHSCRNAKEKLLSDKSLNEISVSIPGRSSNIFANAVSETLAKKDVERIILQGFFPQVSITDHPKANPRSGLSRFSLTYAQEPAITKHLALFLSKQAEKEQSFVAPSVVLFNGGVFKPKILRTQIMQTINKWLEIEGKVFAVELENAEYDTSVAIGATVFADALQGNGIRIKGGASHSFYIGIESPMPAIPGFQPQTEALCIATQGMEAGEVTTYEAETFSLIVGEPVEFRFFAANHRVNDQLGDVFTNWEQAGLIELSPLRLTLSADNYTNGTSVPVHISAMHTEIGTLELTAKSLENNDQWKIAFETIR